jgi:phenylacetate-CoA ligase
MTGGAIEHVHTLIRLWGHGRASREQLITFQNRKLRFLVRHAFHHVPYYRRLFAEAGIGPDRIACAADLALLPVTTKAMLRAEPLENIVAGNVDPRSLITRYSAGSTGEPASIKRTAFEDHLLNMFRIRALAMLGRRPGDRNAQVRSPGVPTDRLPHRPVWTKSIPIFQSTNVNCLRAVEEVAGDLARLRPDVIHGYGTVLMEVASVWPSVAPNGRSPRLIFSGGEALTGSMRARLREGFGADVFNIYGSHEFNLIAWECAETGLLHLTDDNVIVEVVREGRPVAPGETGEVLVTGLHTYASPKIRYALDDYVATTIEESCPCGRPFGALREVRGRTMDYVVLPGGRKMHHWELIPMSFWDLPWHRRYQVVQAPSGDISLRLVAEGKPPPSAVAELDAQIRSKIGRDARFGIEFVDEMAFTSSGKHRLCRSALVSPND